MNYKQLTGTDLLVSGLCLGTVQFGASVGEKECFEQLDEFTDLGGNFLDTAHVYGDWLPGERARSERMIGKWMKQSGRRNHFVISTKGAHQAGFHGCTAGKPEGNHDRHRREP